MFKLILILRKKIFSFFRFSFLSKFFYYLSYLISFFYFLKGYLYNFFYYIASSLFRSRFFLFLKDLYNFFFNKITYVWLLITKHRLFYIVRLLFIVFLLYKPVLVDLDSIYWLSSTVFYFFTNTLFFLSPAIPGSIGFKSWWFYKIFITLGFFPAFWAARRFKKRLFRRRKLLLEDDDVIFIFKWIHKFFIYTLYYIIFFSSFFFISVIIPLIYIYLSEMDPVFVSKLLFTLYFSSYNILFLPFLYLQSFLCFSSLLILFKFCLNFVFFLFYYFFCLVSFFPFFPFLFSFLISCLIFILSFTHVYLSSVYEVLIITISIFITLLQNFNIELFTFKKLNLVIDIFKNFLFSDNYLSFSIMVLTYLFKSVASIILNFLTLFLSLIVAAVRFVIGNTFFDVLSINLTVIWSYLIIFFYDLLISLLQWFENLYDLYLSEVSIFGFFSTWYEYLNNNVQKGNSKNSLINWMLLHIYLSIIVFWVLDFDFRVSAKSPPKTPYTLLEEAKRTYDWIPANMDFGSMQTNHTSIYFALLDISFEHVESLQFIYGDFEYIDEEFDYEDDTPDEEEFWNDSQETTTVRDIIDNDILFGQSRRGLSHIIYNPINAKTSYERHYLTEIVGEPELTFIESELKWMYESIYSPSFEELHFKDSLFSEWVFDPDEDLTLFEVLIFFPLFFYFIYVWFYHRRKRKHYKGWLRFMVPTRRTAYSGSYMEDLLGVSLGNYGKKMFDSMRKYKAPELRVKNFYRLKLQRNNQRLKLLQVESFFFEKLRHKAYRKALKEWEKGLNIGVEFLVPRKRLPQYYSGIKNLKIEMKTWARLGDWIKFDRFSGEHKYKGGLRRYEHYQYDLPALLDMYMMKVARIRKRKRYLWRTINKLPGQNFTASRSKFWHSRFGNTEFFFPSHKMKYNYNYYNYIGWRDNRTHWRRYAFTPGNVTNKVWALNRDVPEGGYRSFRGHQKKRRLMKSFQF